VKTRAIAVVVCLTLVLPLGACESIPQEHKGAAVGAGAGAATGALAGALIGDTKGAVIGGLLGALAGGAIGHYAYDQRQTGEETAKKYNYEGSEGKLLTLEEASAVPQTVRPGNAVDLKMTYAVLTPPPHSSTQITEVREITHNGQLVGKPEANVTRNDGTYTSTVPLQLPPDAKTGLYLVKATVKSGDAQDTLETSFTVR
jgi:hypothetical protein